MLAAIASSPNARTPDHLVLARRREPRTYSFGTDNDGLCSCLRVLARAAQRLKPSVPNPILGVDVPATVGSVPSVAASAAITKKGEAPQLALRPWEDRRPDQSRSWSRGCRLPVMIFSHPSPSKAWPDLVVPVTLPCVSPGLKSALLKSKKQTRSGCLSRFTSTPCRSQRMRLLSLPVSPNLSELWSTSSALNVSEDSNATGMPPLNW